MNKKHIKFEYHSIHFLMEQFECIKQIGRGGYGSIYLVKSLSDESLKVIKEVDTSNMSKEECERSKKEVEILRELKHINIIQYISYNVRNQKLYILMEYADGGDLSDKISEQRLRKKRFREELIVDWFVQMCLSIKYIHDRKIIHRDIKPSNFFFTKTGTIKLGDFGLSAYVEYTEAKFKSRYGTPYYLSPELCNGEKYNQKTDIWSLGCVLYELCTLKKAFNGLTLKLIIESIKNDEPVRISSIYSQELRSLIKLMLNKDQNQRPSINDILKIPLIKYKAIALLGKTQARNELNHSIFHGEKPGKTPEEYKVKEYVNQHIQLLNNNNFKFMGKNLVLSHLNDNDSLSQRAESLRSFIEEMISIQKFVEMYHIILSGDEANFKKITSKMADKYIVKLILQLIELEETINKINIREKLI